MNRAAEQQNAPHVFSFEERYKAGKARRAATPREKLGDFSPSYRDPVAIIAETNKTRLQTLVPIRRERMATSAFAFLRGAAAVMAADLAPEPAPGIPVQACGDCHLMNFGAFLSPEGNALFDINDFDETLPGVDFTVDLKRLAASFAVAALAAGDSDKRVRRIAKGVATAYRERIAKLAELSPVEAWNSRMLVQREAADLFDDKLAASLRQAAGHKHPERDGDADFPHVKRDPASGEWRIEDHPPLIYHAPQSQDPSLNVDLARVFAQVAETLPIEVKQLLPRYKLADDAFKVVGVGSVGTYCAIGLFMSPDDFPLFLQLKEALPSALERLRGNGAVPNSWLKPWLGQQGARVVSGQRIMQAAADVFLGYTRDEASGREFYVRRLKNRRLGSVSELLETKALPQYATLCGRTLARAHARSGDAATLWGYMGKSEAFDDAIASFAMLYAAQNKKDFETFVENTAPQGEPHMPKDPGPSGK
ncbi:MAG TPA: DUF2252 domain-containing protein [Methylocystis sp.]|nr:DUF2252 domain-containing protein [Methylocystis sp.]